MSLIENPSLEEVIKFGYLDDLTGERVGPQPKQALAHTCTADILFYGGQAGGGKSEFQIVEGITSCLEFEDIDWAIFRRTNDALEESLILRYHKLVPHHHGKPIATFNGSKLCATFHDTGSRLWFHSLPHDKEVFSHQSAEWQGLGIDESTHFTEFAIKYLITRVRGGRRRRIILTANPGGVGHGYHRRWFMKPDPHELGGRPMPQPLEVWRPYPKPGDPTKPEEVLTRCFIPASLDDNPALLKKDPTYRARIYQLGGVIAKQLAEGDWEANDSMIVGSVWKERHQVTEKDEALIAQGVEVGRAINWHVIPLPDWRPPTESLLYGAVDYGFGAPWAWYVTAALPGGHTRTFLERYQTRLRDEDQAELIAQDLEKLQEQGYKFGWIVMDPAMWNSRAEMGIAKSIAEVYIDRLGQYGVHIMPGAKGRGARVSRPQRWLSALSMAPDGLPWWSCTTACSNLIRTLPDIPWDPDDPEVEDGDSENHCLVGETVITTALGPCSIDRVTTDDVVLTRQGWKQVLRAWRVSDSEPVYTVTFSDGRAICGTSEHPVWIEGRGWVPIRLLAKGLIAYDMAWLKPRWSSRRLSRSGAACATTAWTADTSATSDILGFIDASGWMCMVQSRRGGTCTIATATLPTTTRTISKFCRRLATLLRTRLHRATDSAKRAVATWRSPARRDCPSLSSRTPVSSAVPSSWPDQPRTHASTAHRRVAHGSTSGDGLRVVSVRPAGYAPVYDLTVADAHEFFANGVLVHNSYEAMGRFFEARPHAPTVRPEDVRRAKELARLDPLSRKEAERVEKVFSPKAPRNGTFGRW